MVVELGLVKKDPYVSGSLMLFTHGLVSNNMEGLASANQTVQSKMKDLPNLPSCEFCDCLLGKALKPSYLRSSSGC